MFNACIQHIQSEATQLRLVLSHTDRDQRRLDREGVAVNGVPGLDRKLLNPFAEGKDSGWREDGSP